MKKLYKALFCLMCALILVVKSNASDYYWVGNGGNWSDVSHHWATASGGSAFQTIVPTSADNIIFDVNSFSIGGQTIIVDQTVVQCKDMTWTGVTNTPTLSLPSNNTFRIFGSVTFVAGMNANISGPVSFEAASAGKTITSAGKTFYYITFDGTGGVWTLQDAINVSDHLYINNGTLNTNDKTVQAQYFQTNGTAPTLNMGASVFNVVITWFTNSPGFVVNAGTSAINITGSGNTEDFYGGGHTYYNLNFTSPVITATLRSDNNVFNGDVKFFGPGDLLGNNNTFNQNCTFLKDGIVDEGDETYNTLTLTAGFTYSLAPGKTQTINGSIVANGNCGALINISSGSNGIAATIKKTTGSINLSYVTLKDIAATGGASFTANNAINFGNNTGWAINPLVSKNLYWVGNGGNWSDGNHWSLSSGGAGSGCSPTAVDNVFFDANSFTSSGQTVTVNSPTGYFNDMSWTGVTNTPLFYLPSTNLLRVFGSLTFSAGMNTNLQALVRFESAASGKTITSAGETFYQVTFNGIGGSWTLQDGFSVSNALNITNGTLNSNDKTVQTLYFDMAGATPTLNMGASVFTIFSHWQVANTGVTINAGTSTINMTGSSGIATFYGGGHNYYNLNFTSTTITGYVYTNSNIFNGNVSFSGPGEIHDINNVFNQNCTFLKNGIVSDGNQTYNTLTLTPGFSYTFASNSIQTINGSIAANGNCGAFINIRSITNGVATIIQKTTGSITLSYVTFRDITASGGAAFTANNSINFGNTTGWTINQPASKNLYWVGNGGNWSDGNHWSLSSGGAGSGCSPSAVDNIFFDANSFTLSGQTVAINSPTGYFNDMNWTGVTHTPILSLPSTNTLRVFGSLTFAAGMNTNMQGPVSFEAKTSGKTVTSAGKTYFQVIFDGIGGNWTLQDAINVSDHFYINNGTLNTNDKTVQAQYFETNGAAPTLNMGASVFNISITWYTISPGFVVNSGTSTINITGSGSSADFSGWGHSFYNLNFTSPAILATLRTANNVFNGNVVFSGPAMIQNANNVFNQSCIFLKDAIIADAETYNILKLAAGFTYTFQANTIQTITPGGGIAAQGNPGFPIRIQSSSAGTPVTFFKSSGSICLDYVRLSDNIATGGAVFNAGLSPARSVDMGGNSGWLFTGGCILLPVKLLSFTADKSAGNTVLLHWKTASEENTDHFVVERSADGTNYVYAGEKPAAGNSTSINSYSFTDVQPLRGTTFYRLKTVDIDNGFSYSKAVAVKINSRYVAELFPNPVKDVVYVQINNRNTESANVIISDAAGKLVRHEKINLNGSTSFSINIEQLPKGIYYLQVNSQSIREKMKFVKM